MNKAIIIATWMLLAPMTASANENPADPGQGAQAGSGSETNKEQSISNWGWGLGIGIEHYRQHPYIDQASTYGANRIVVVEREYQTNPSAWLTLNWNIWPRPQSTGEERIAGASSEVQKVKWGFFAGAKILDANSQALSAFALGPQVSFFTADKQVSVGFGWVIHRTKGFATGIVEGQALPAQYTDIKYRESSENSYMVMFSVSL